MHVKQNQNKTLKKCKIIIDNFTILILKCLDDGKGAAQVYPLLLNCTIYCH